MKEIWRVYLYSIDYDSEGFSKPELNELKNTFDAVRFEESKDELIYFPDNKAQLNQIRFHVEDSGKTWPESEFPTVDGIRVTCNLTYTESELSSSKYLQLFSAPWIGKGTYSSPPQIEEAISSPFSFGRLERSTFAISTELRPLIEAENFKGLKLRRLDLTEGRGESKVLLLGSDVELPSVENVTKSEAWRPEETYLCDGYVIENRIHYNESLMPDFDIAFTRECFGPHPKTSRALMVCSQRFRGFLEQHSEELRWRVVITQ